MYFNISMKVFILIIWLTTIIASCILPQLAVVFMIACGAMSIMSPLWED